MKTTHPRGGSLPLATRAALAAALLASAAFAVSILASPPPDSDGRVTHTVSGNTETWRIDEPNVKKKIIEFQQIRFQAGDKVRVTGGGCVQTGGHGKTWKRYVDPLGPNSDKLYHGMVLIPGAIGELPADSLDRFARILIVKGHDFTVQGITEPRKQHLWLGYEDDDYGDNGYYSQDEGTQGQCKIGNSWVEHAFAVVTITHGGAPPTPSHLAPFDITANTLAPGNVPVDDNFILLNPVWGRQITNHDLPDHSQCGGGDPYSSPCTTQPTEEDHGFLCSYGTLGIVDGHHNWVAGTYEGTIFWNDQSSWIADGDYNFRLVRPDDAGMTVENKIKTGPNRKSMKLEFSSDETIYHFETPWWDRFHKAVDDSFSAANAMVTGPDGTAGAFGIVSGLIGLDCPHTCASEIHPVWAMAIRVNSDPADETWAVFVRRFGNEGFCSDQQHYLDDLLNDTYTFRLPWRPGATDVGVNPSTDFESRLGQATGSLGVAKNQGVLLSFTMAVPPNPLFPGEMVNGELHLKWTVPPGGTIHLPVDGTIAVATDGRPRQPVAEQPEDEPEDRIGRLFAAMTPAQRLTIAAKARQPTATHQKAALRMAAPRMLASLPIRTARARGPVARAVADPQKKAMDQKRLDALHAVYGAEIPGFSNTRLRITPRPRVP
jgi:hypothetical protein